MGDEKGALYLARSVGLDHVFTSNFNKMDGLSSSNHGRMIDHPHALGSGRTPSVTKHRRQTWTTR